MLLKEIFNRGPRVFPDQEAIIDGKRRFTYRQWGDRQNRLANALIGLGLEKGDVLGVLLKNCAEFMDALGATAKTGVILAGINYRVNSDGIRRVIENLECRVLLVHAEYVDMINAMRPQLPFLKVCIVVGCEAEGMIEYESLIKQHSSVEPDVPLHEDDPDLIVFTSGTTGTPKGCLSTRRQTVSRASIIGMRAEVKEHDRFIAVIPLFHVFTANVLGFVLGCATFVLMKDWDPMEFCRLVDEEKITKSTLSQTFISFILNLPDLKKYNLQSLKQIRYGTAPMAPEILKRAIKLLPGCDFLQTYGGSEASEVIALTAKDHRDALEGGSREQKRLSSAGKGTYFHHVRVVKEDGSDVKPGEVGEIIVKGPGVMRGYWKMPAETSEKIKDGWLYTVDLATVDEDGYIYIVDRKNNMIITGGENVYPARIESILFEMPEVAEAAVIGVPDDKWGEAVKAIIVLKPGTVLTQEQVINFCAHRLANYEKPKSVDFVDALPYLPTSKLDRVTLKKQFIEK